jgi:hypothetical protein
MSEERKARQHPQRDASIPLEFINLTLDAFLYIRQSSVAVFRVKPPNYNRPVELCNARGQFKTLKLSLVLPRSSREYFASMPMNSLPQAQRYRR